MDEFNESSIIYQSNSDDESAKNSEEHAAAHLEPAVEEADDAPSNSSPTAGGMEAEVLETKQQQQPEAAPSQSANDASVSSDLTPQVSQTEAKAQRPPRQKQQAQVGKRLPEQLLPPMKQLPDPLRKLSAQHWSEQQQQEQQGGKISSLFSALQTALSEQQEVEDSRGLVDARAVLQGMGKVRAGGWYCNPRCWASTSVSLLSCVRHSSLTSSSHACTSGGEPFPRARNAAPCVKPPRWTGPLPSVSERRQRHR